MLENLFKRHYGADTLKSRAWLKNVSPEDRKTFGRIGYDELMHLYGYEDGFHVLHRAGGVKRATTAKRDRKGRFIGQKASIKR